MRSLLSSSLPALPSGEQQKVLQFTSESYASLLHQSPEARPVLPFDPEIDNLRPKSPQRRGRTPGGQPQAQAGFGGTSSPPPQQYQSQMRGSFRGGSSRGRGTRGGGYGGGHGSFGEMGRHPLQAEFGQNMGPFQPSMTHHAQPQGQYGFDHFGNPVGMGFDPRGMSQQFQPGGMMGQTGYQETHPGLGGMYPTAGMGMGRMMSSLQGFNPNMAQFNPQMAFLMAQQQQQMNLGGVGGPSMGQGEWQMSQGQGYQGGYQSHNNQTHGWQGQQQQWYSE